MFQDLRFGARMFVRKPGFTAVAVLTLALGVGANTMIFSVVNGVLLHPLPYRDSERIMRVMVSNQQRGIADGPVSYLRYEDLRDRNRSFEKTAAFAFDNFNLTGQEQPEQLQGVRASASLFEVLGVNPARGRLFLPEEDRPGGAQVALVSYGLWQRRFGGDPNLVGRALTLDGSSYTVVGIMPRGFSFPAAGVELWTTKVFETSRLTPEQIRKGAGYVTLVARLKPGVEREAAESEMRVLSQQYQQQNPTLTDADPNATVDVLPLQEQLVRNVRPLLLTLFCAVGFVLLIACANVANLLLARAAARRREMTIRAVLGAGRVRIIRQLLTESALLALAGGGGGVLLALWGTKALVAAAGESVPRAEEVSVDGRVLLFSLLVSLLTGVAFGLAPALRAAKLNPNETLKEGGRGSSGGVGGNRVRGALIVSEVALSLVLVTGAALMMQSFARLQRVNLGFDTRQLLTLNISLPQAKYPETSQKLGFYSQVLQRVEALPGVKAAGMNVNLPPNGGVRAPFLVEGAPPLAFGERPLAAWNSVSAGYFQTMGIPLLKGRLFDERDRENSQTVAIISRGLADSFFQGADPLGRQITVGRMPGPSVVVGVVGDVKNAGLSAEPAAEVYTPFAQRPWTSMNLVVRTQGDPLGLAGEVRAQVLSVDGDQPVTNVQTMEQNISDIVAQPRLTMILLGIFAGVAMALAAVGLYGVMSYSVAQRTHEIGLRMALGAQGSEILRAVIRQGMTLALAGVLIGLAGSFFLTQLMSSLLFGVTGRDPLTFIAVSLILSFVALLACYLPARRATKVEPLIALRYE
jgi:putative ABC transport system permease protein